MGLQIPGARELEGMPGLRTFGIQSTYLAHVYFVVFLHVIFS